MVHHCLLHELMRMLRASPYLTQIVAVRVWQPSKRHTGGEDLFCLSMATLALVRRCSVLSTGSDILVWLGRHLVCGRISWLGSRECCIHCWPKSLGRIFARGWDFQAVWRRAFSRVVFHSPAHHVHIVICVAFLDSSVRYNPLFWYSPEKKTCGNGEHQSSWRRGSCWLLITRLCIEELVQPRKDLCHRA